ncbi:MAG: hypothetical protein HZA11_12460 [Nitrospirae bacterium]|nr:hypothetical protein [Nitrospirota bacterium]
MINEKDLLESIISIFAGLYFLFFIKWHIKSSVNQDKRWFKADTNPLSYKIGYSIGGIFFLIFGILLLFGVIKLGKN